MSLSPSISIASAPIELGDSVRLAVGEIERFLGIWYPQTLLAQSKAAKAIAGQWLSRVKGFHAQDDFVQLVRAVLAQCQSGKERTAISDQLAYYFSGFMPTYGAACTLLGMVGDRLPWSEVQAFMHSQSYGDARTYVEGFDWQGGLKKAQAELQAWVDVAKAEVGKLDALVAQADRPVLLALAPPAVAPPVTDVPLRPYMLPPTPPVVEPPLAPAAGRGLLALLGEAALPVLVALVIVLVPGNIGQKNDEDETMRRIHEEAARRRQLAVIDTQARTDAASNATNNECAPQTEQNRKNGAECENDGYVIMETALKFKRLVDPPKGRGLDGLFEKLPAFDQPNPMPQTVSVPKPGRLLFLPTQNKPPNPGYDFTGKPPVSSYPKFVVFEGKHISKSFDENDSDGITRETKNRLKNTCDGQQMSEKWTEERIPQALNRGNPGSANKASRTKKEKEITNAGYARWIFVCLPGPIGSNTKLYVLIDVVASGMDLESMTPRPRKTPDASNGY